MTVEEIFAAMEECNFDNLTCGNVRDQVIDAIEEALSKEIFFQCGVTKVAIFFPDTDFVIKIPLGGYEEEEEEYNEECKAYYPTGDSYFSPFCFADDEETGDDYCKVEVVRYQHALNYDDGEVAQLFARTSFLGYIHDYPIYMQPICEAYEDIDRPGGEDYERSHACMSSTIDTCHKNGYSCFNAIWLTQVMFHYGENVFNELCSFIQKEKIDDLHGGNIGYYQGKPVIFDYSGYND